MDSAKQDLEVRYRGSWRQEVLARARRLRSELPPDGDPQTRDLIAIAGDAAVRSGSVRYWWNGTLIERAWLALHEAEARLVARLPRDKALLWWQCTTGNRPRATGSHSAAGLGNLPADPETAAISLRAYYDEADQLFSATRVLRNRLIVMTLAGLATTGLLLLAGGLGGLRISSGSTPIVSGIVRFVIVALFGAVGAFISGLPALSSLSRRPVAYRTAPYQLSLKLAVGPVFALVGVMTLGAGFIDHVNPLPSPGETVLLWAVIFGGAQQLVTRMLDRKAAGLADASAAVRSGEASSPDAPRQLDALFVPQPRDGRSADDNAASPPRRRVSAGGTPGP